MSCSWLKITGPGWNAGCLGGFSFQARDCIILLLGTVVPEWIRIDRLFFFSLPLRFTWLIVLESYGYIPNLT